MTQIKKLLTFFALLNLFAIAHTPLALANNLIWTLENVQKDQYTSVYGTKTNFVINMSLAGGVIVPYSLVSPGTFEEFRDTNGNYLGAHISAIVAQQNAPQWANHQWQIDFWYDAVATGTPRYDELKSSALKGNGGPVNFNEWRFYNYSDTKTSALIGLGENEGKYLSVSNRKPLQVGVGANNYSVAMGGETLFNAPGNCWVAPKGWRSCMYVDGEMKFNLSAPPPPTTPVPEPATLTLFGLGSSALCLFRRKSAAKKIS